MTSVPTGIVRGPDQTDESSLERLPLAVLELDGDLRAVDVNQGWVQLCGRSQHDSRGSLWWQSVDPRDRAALQRALSSPAPSDDVRAEHRVVGAGDPRWTRWWWRHDGDRTWACVADVDADWSRTRDLWRRATHDPLTGLANRTEFMTLLERALDRAIDHPALAVVFVDLDHFKGVNDSAGHRAGDAVLAAVAHAIVEAVRPFDVAGRLGGDEFAVLCPGLTSEDETTALATRIRDAVAASEAVTGIPISGSAGVAVSVAGDGSADSLVARADQAMYRDKSARRPPSPSGGGRPAPLSADVGEQHVAAVLVPMLFRLGLSLHAVADAADDLTASRVRDVVEELDDVIASLRHAAFAHLRDTADAASVRVAFRRVESAIAGAEHAVRQEWAKTATSASDDPGLALRLVRSSRLLRAAERALEPDALG
ncbi:MAG TPA: sensor domain-containing diguanylate cyclase [Acidimicrobiales bacterium]|nr:sensor domain-containing diguanylate cyclase [Acidimicrobiales bacterium]